MKEKREPLWRRYARFLRPDVASDVDDELELHLALRANEFERRGMSPGDARRAAVSRFGDVNQVTQWLHSHDHAQQRTKRRQETLSMVMQHLRFATRSLLKQPAFSAAAIVTLAFGIGATAAVFAVVNGVLLKPLPYSEPEQLVTVKHTSPALATGTSVGQSHGTYETYRRLSRLTASSGLQETISLSITDGVTPERVQADSVTSGVLTTLRVPALLGRVFNENDERPGHIAVAIISEGFWRRRFVGDPAVIGRSLQIDGRAHEIVGVLPSHMRYPNEGVVLWLPLELSDADPVPGSLRYESVSRLRPGVTREAAEREYSKLAPRGSDFFSVAAPGISMAKWLEMVKPRPTLRPLRDEMVGDIGPVLWVMLGTIAFVLLAACTNIATLFLVRAEGRQRELAVRSALGAGRLDAIARFVSEGLIVAVTDAVIGSLGAYVAIAALRRSSTFPIPRLGEIDLDGTVLLATIGITLLVALFTSALPILRFGRRDLSPILRSGGRSATAGNDRRRVQGALVTTQVALAFVLLAASTLMARSFFELRQVQPGFDVDRVEAFRLSLPTATYVGDTVITQLYERLNAQLSAIPGVERVGIASWLPLENEGSSLSTAFREGAPPAEQEAPPVAPQVLASATYFKAVGIPFVVGRTFREIPNGSRSDEVVVSRAFAQQSLGGGELSSAIGKRLKFLPQGPWMTIVGVVGDSHLEGLERPPSAAVYLPLSSQAYGNLPSLPMDFGVVVRTQGEPSSLASVIRREVASVDPQLPIYNLRPMRDVLRVSMARTSMTALMLLVSAAVAMALGAIGLYGVVSYTVGMRTREIGLRLALGEQPQSIMRRFAREGAVLAIVGVAVGLGGALLVSRVLRGLLYGIGPNDPMVLGGAALVLVATALLASWVPARRASQLDPASVLASD